MALRRRIANGGGLDRKMKLPLTSRERADLVDLFGAKSLSGPYVHLDRMDKALLEGAYALPLRQLLIGVDGPLLTKRGQARYRKIVKKHRIHRARATLAARLTGVPELEKELALLTALTDPSSWLPPENSMAATRTWATYNAALCAAAEWFQGQSRQWKFAERELAVRALGGSKRWTQPAKNAFSSVIGLPFDQAVYSADTGIRMLGPASWQLDSLVADGAAARPFVDVPGKAAATQGTLDVAAVGVLLIENQETFQALSRTSVPEEWLCIWMEGYASEALVMFLTRLPDIPVTAWGDLDPPGIDIIVKLSAKSGRAITPIGMTPELYAAGYMLEEEDEALAAWREQAEKLNVTAPEVFRPLARAIADNNGYRCEQEGLHEFVLPCLHDHLTSLFT
ncbi:MULTISPECIES: Wadjet anti-phage system protein JetD domain-containing protein [unclassified Streptomyces]|uniref:Wadjet anti-phage system protein JetD domain-containing protein n=1 Tax=unclassified Streptomyces TaxID=2593676 RepID=UPI002E198CA6|nr:MULTISPECIES: Wadjet anti-phage system protein JetD domain-containing protein [unclassified Streptomyces]